MLAKLALDNDAKKRPPWIARWSYESIDQTVWKIKPMTAFWGISKGYDKKLKQMGIYSIENLAHFDPNRLKKHLGIMGLQLYYHAWGLDASIIREKAPVKNRSYSKNQTLMRDYFSKAEILIIIKEMVGDVCERLRKHQEKCNEIFLGIGYANRNLAEELTIKIKLSRPENSTAVISELARREFSEKWQGQPVRSVNITASKIVSLKVEQMELFCGDIKKNTLDQVVDSLRDRFGKTSIFYAGSLAGGTFLERAHYVGGHKGSSE